MRNKSSIRTIQIVGKIVKKKKQAPENRGRSKSRLVGKNLGPIKMQSLDQLHFILL